MDYRMFILGALLGLVIAVTLSGCWAAKPRPAAQAQPPTPRPEPTASGRPEPTPSPRPSDAPTPAATEPAPAGTDVAPEPTPAAPQDPWQQMLDELEALGFFGDADPAVVSEAKACAVQAGPYWGLCLMEFGLPRVCSADAEFLAEGGVVEFLEQVSPFLATQGVHLEASQEDPGQSYVVTVNGERYLIFGPDEGSRFPGSARALALVNVYLERAGSRERLYAAYVGGEEGWAAFLTPEMYRAIDGSGLFSEWDRLYPMDDYPARLP